jgi:hypothetical protein
VRKGVSTPKKLMPVIVLVNAILILLFVLTNIGIWEEFNSEPNLLHYISFGLFSIQDTHAGIIINGTQWSPVNGIVLMQNSPFWIFFIAIAVNLFFIMILAKNKRSI